MKYIRTKDGIGKVGIDFNGNYCVWYQHNWYYLEDLEKDIIKQADTIEELCDDFITERKNGGHTNLYNWVNRHKLFNGMPGESQIVAYYGAIWTNKGLIYVAKMNERGDLELL